MDNRLGSLASTGKVQVSYSYLDDDNVASYNISSTGNNANSFFKTITGTDQNASYSGT